MGEILSIRVRAQTLSEEDVAQAGTALCSRVWREWMTSRKLRGQGMEKLMGPVTGPGPVEKFLGGRKHGVVELASDLADLMRFGDLPPQVAEALKEPVEEVERARQALSKALGDWAVQAANTATDDLEKALGEAESALERLESSAK